MEIEICIDRLEQARAALKFGAKRVELCSALDLGGLTPSFGLTRQCADLGGLEVHVMIRTHGGGFIYSIEDIEIMKFDMESLHKAGATGVVFGVLNKNRFLNIEHNRQLFMHAKSLGLEVTFHRAFDFVENPQESLEKLIEIGFDRLLTSGQKSTAIEGIDLIRNLVEQSNGRIEIMAGSGVNSDNVKKLQAIGIDAIHFTARKPIKVTDMNMGQDYIVDIEKLISIGNQIRN
jgi:copper homeostasis protein